MNIAVFASKYEFVHIFRESLWGSGGEDLAIRGATINSELARWFHLFTGRLIQTDRRVWQGAEAKKNNLYDYLTGAGTGSTLPAEGLIS
jgi:hypothetical protein